MKVWAGIDPGNEGALSLIAEDGTIEFFDAPTALVRGTKKTRTVLVPQEMARIIKDIRARWQPSRFVVYLEKVAAMKKQGVTSMFNFGMGYGMWQGVLAGMGVSYDFVTPQRWKRELLSGMGKEKDASCVKAMQMFPAYSSKLHRPKRGGGVRYLHGRADALLLAEFGRRTYEGGVLTTTFSKRTYR